MSNNKFKNILPKKDKELEKKGKKLLKKINKMPKVKPLPYFCGSDGSHYLGLTKK